LPSRLSEPSLTFAPYVGALHLIFSKNLPDQKLKNCGDSDVAGSQRLGNYFIRKFAGA
jgi:hypothetical protein